MKVFVTGSDGQLGRTLADAAPEGVDLAGGDENLGAMREEPRVPHLDPGSPGRQLGRRDDAGAVRLEPDAQGLVLGGGGREERIAAGKFHPGSPFLVLTYPQRFEANDAGFPITRQAVLASHPLLPASSHPVLDCRRSAA